VCNYIHENKKYSTLLLVSGNYTPGYDDELLMIFFLLCFSCRGKEVAERKWRRRRSVLCICTYDITGSPIECEKAVHKSTHTTCGKEGRGFYMRQIFNN
jgi:hypothetical protein